MLVRPGMGVVVDPPLDARALAANVETVFGTVKDIDNSGKTLTIRLLLGSDNLPEYEGWDPTSCFRPTLHWWFHSTGSLALFVCGLHSSSRPIAFL